MCLRHVLGLVLLMAAQALGQLTPFTATQTHTRDVISADGRVINHLRTEKRYFFASSGSILIQDLTPEKVPIRAQLLDYGRSNKAYLIDYMDENAQEQRALDKQPQRPHSRAEVKNSLGDEVLQGVPCFIVPIYQWDARGGRELIGRAWVAPALNFLPVREDSTTKLSDGNTVHVVIEFSEVRLGVEPDASLFATDSTLIRRAKNLAR